jgi:hypothetical protein
LARLEVVQQIELDVVDERRVDFVQLAVAVRVLRGRASGRPLEFVEHRIVLEPGDALGRPGSGGIGRRAEHGVPRLQAHLGVEGADQELANRRRQPLVQKRPHAQIRVDAFDGRGIHSAIGIRRDPAEVDALGRERARDGRRPRPRSRSRRARDDARLRFAQRLRANRAEVRGHLVAEHLDQAQTEQVRRVATIGKRRDVAADAGGAARPAVTRGTTVRQPGAEAARLRDVAARVLIHARPQAFIQTELALEQLPAAPDGPCRVAFDQIRGRPRRVDIALAGPDLHRQGLLDAAARRVDETKRVDESALVELRAGLVRRACEREDSANR